MAASQPREPLKFSVGYRRVFSPEPYQTMGLEINSEFYHDQISVIEARKQLATMVREGLLDELAREHEFTLRAEAKWKQLSTTPNTPPQPPRPQEPLWHPSKKDPDAAWAYADDSRIRDLAENVRLSPYQKAQLSGFSYKLSTTSNGKEFLWRRLPHEEVAR